jgi:decaprenylphospho-beta-D-erythro-pentofuranosid-2-ulose 2-reductase
VRAGVTAAGSAGRRVVVLGGTSEIALAIVGELARREPREVALVGRDRARLEAAAEMLRGDGCPRVVTTVVDALDTDRHDDAVGEAFAALGGADIVILAVGLLGERGGLPRDVDDALAVLRVNVVGAGSLLIRAAQRLRDQHSGTLVVLSSVAGERVRASNVVYGAAKTSLDALALGIADALHRDGVRVLVVRPGFVTTSMTRGLAPAPLAVGPQAVAVAVLRGLDRGAAVVWAPAALRWLMLALRLLPRRVFRALPL